MPTEQDAYENWADEYDTQSLKHQWQVPSALFGMMYLQLHAGQSLLDLGMGTGLGSLPFHKAGLKIHGLEKSPAMIGQCRNRGLPWELYHHDLTNIPWPVEDDCIDHVISAGVFHFIGELDTLISEASRVIRSGGLFGFDFDEFQHDDRNDYSLLRNGVYETFDAKYDQHFYRHAEDYVREVLSNAGFRVLHDTEFLASKETKRYFRLFVSKHR